MERWNKLVDSVIRSPVYNMQLRRVSSGFDPNNVAGLIIDVDARDLLTPGVITSVADRKNGYVFTGAAERGARINGFPSIDFNFANSPNDILTTTTPVTQLAGANVVTTICVVKNQLNPTNSGVIIGHYAAGEQPQFLLYSYQNIIYNYVEGNVSFSQLHTIQSLMTPVVLSAKDHINAADASTSCNMRVNGTPSTMILDGANVNTNTFAAKTLSMGAVPPHAFYWQLGSIGKLLVYATAAPLTTADYQYVERGIGDIWGVTVA